MNKILIGAGALAIIAVVAFVGLRGGQAPATHTAVAGAPSAQYPAPDFSLERVGGGTLALSEYKGKKPVILDFWATWCPNCRRDIPRQQAWYEKYKDQVEVIGINLQENPSLVAGFVSQFGITYPVVLDPRAQAARAFNVQYTNYHVLIDTAGNIVRTIPGDISERDFQSLIPQQV